MNDMHRQGPLVIRVLFYTLLVGGIGITAFVYWRSQASSDYSGIQIQPLVPLDAV
jgi:hypothetical protein